MITDDSLHGRRVLSADGIAIGDVTHLLVEPGEWRVRALEVKLRSDVAERIGAHKPLLRSALIEIPTEQVQSLGDAIILAVPVDALRSEPAPRGDEVPVAPM